MIQRIQSLYLFVAAVLMAFFAFIPFTGYTFIYEGQAAKSLLSVWALGEFISGAIYVGIAVIISALLPLATIFIFRKRRLQITLCMVGIVLLLLIQAAVIWEINNLKSYLLAGTLIENMKIIYAPIAFFPIVSAILVFLARAGVLHDEKLVRSLERIR